MRANQYWLICTSSELSSAVATPVNAVLKLDLTEDSAARPRYRSNRSNLASNCRTLARTSASFGSGLSMLIMTTPYIEHQENGHQQGQNHHENHSRRRLTSSLNAFPAMAFASSAADKTLLQNGSILFIRKVWTRTRTWVRASLQPVERAFHPSSPHRLFAPGSA